MRDDVTLLTDHDIYRFKEGTHFAVRAPNGEGVSVIGDFNQWDKDSHPCR